MKARIIHVFLVGMHAINRAKIEGTMSNYPGALPERNPVTRQAHRHQVFWQISVPLILGALVLIIVAVLAALSSAGTASLWADIALIWLILPAMMGALIFTLIFAGLAYGVIYVIRVLPGFALKAQDLIARIGDKIKEAGDVAAAPVIRVQSLQARWQALKHRLIHWG
jgi:high-affinity K+ transport system ATPase subunit B